MLIKFLDHGTGSGVGAARYLLDKEDHNGIERTEVKVLRGDPVLVGKVADSLHFKNRYTSGVIAFAPTDNPTDEQINQVLNEFERVAFAGIGQQRISYSAIFHREENGGCHIHIFSARVDLETWKSFNMAPPGWEKAFDPVRDFFNHTYGWACPDDQNRARNLQPGKQRLIDAQKLKRGLQIEPDTKAIITEYLEQQIVAGNVTNRASMLDIIEKAGLKINRAGKDYITIIDDEGSKFRLKGAIYGAEWNISRTLEIEDSRRQNSVGKPDQRSAHRARKELEEAIKRRTEYNKNRYATVSKISEFNAQPDAATTTVADDVATDRQRLPVTANSVERRRLELVDVESNGQPSTTEATANKSTGSRVLRKSSRSKELQTEGVNHDGIRTAINECITEIEHRIIATSESFDRAIGYYDKELSNFKSANAVFVQANRNLKTGIKQMIDNHIDELEKFKVNIDLVEFAETFGYLEDEKLSSQNSIFMKSITDEIVITTENNQGIYFNIHNDNDKGNIVNFLQKHKKLNLDQVRKELRPWIGVGDYIINRKQVSKRPKKPIEASKDQAAILREYYRLHDYKIGYLEHEHNLSEDTIKAFLDIIRTDRNGNTCFIHKDGTNVTGWEVINSDFSGFSQGTKSLSIYYPDNNNQPEQLIIIDSIINAMSYYQLHGMPGDVYVSFAGDMSDKQQHQLQTLMTSFQNVCIATNNDKKGNEYADMVYKWRPDAQRALPSHDGHDWNQVLKDTGTEKNFIRYKIK